MSNIELNVLMNHLDKILYFVSRNIRNEKSAQMVAIMTKLAQAIKPIYDELSAIRQAG